MLVYALIVLQVLVPIGFFFHGLSKVRDVDGTLRWFKKQGLGRGAGVVAMVLETVGPVLLVLGLFVQVVAALLAVQMFVAMTTHWRSRDSFLGGWEEAFLYCVVFFVLALSGGGYSLLG